MKTLEQNLRDSIKGLEAEIDTLNRRHTKLNRELLNRVAPFKVGQIIDWDHGKQVRKGKIVKLSWWVEDQIEYGCQTIKKDGTTGSYATVPPYMNPRATQPEHV